MTWFRSSGKLDWEIVDKLGHSQNKKKRTKSKTFTVLRSIPRERLLRNLMKHPSVLSVERFFFSWVSLLWSREPVVCNYQSVQDNKKKLCKLWMKQTNARRKTLILPWINRKIIDTRKKTEISSQYPSKRRGKVECYAETWRFQLKFWRESQRFDIITKVSDQARW